MYKTDSIENLITNILSEIDRSLIRRIQDFRLELETFTNKKRSLKYIKNEKTDIRKSINEVTYKHRTAIDKYRDYIVKVPRDEVSRRKSIYDFIYTMIICYSDNELKTKFFNSSSYKEQKKLEIVKNLVQRATLLEFNYFLTGEINRIKQEISNQLDSKNNKLNWKGSKAELIELLKALIENGNIEGTQKNIISSFTNFLNVELKEPKSTIQRLDKRKDKTIFLDKLKSSLIEFYLKKDE
jgi:hypothetical protein